jgi:hypothetical protein
VSRLIVILALLVGCKTGGDYVQNSGGRGGGGENDRGEVNGRMFDFVSNKPEGDDWQIRIRDSSMSVGYGNEEETENHVISLSKKETTKVWKLIDALDLENRKKGKKDEDEGWVQLRIREPGGEEGHDIVEVFVSRATADDDVIALADFLREIVSKHLKEKPNF